MNRKIKSQKEIIVIVRFLKKQGKKVVTYNGSFDVLHIGHIKALEEAKRQGDVLAVLLNSDSSIRNYKGPNRPINSQEHRAELLSAIGHVDHVVCFNEINPVKLLEKIKPDIHCTSSEWGKNSIAREVVEKHGGSMHLLPWTDGFSTSNVVERILQAHHAPDAKAVFLDINAGASITKKLSKSGYRVIVGKLEVPALLKAAKNFKFNLSKSWLVGGREQDIIAGRQVNIKTIKIGKKMPVGLKLEPHFYAKDLPEATKIVLKK